MNNFTQNDIAIFDNLLKKFTLLIPQWIKPNHLTVLRLLLIIVLILFFLNQQYSVALTIFLLAAFTDAIDGTLARQRQQKTKFGAIVDPLADKLLIITLIILFAKFLPWQIVELIITIELGLILGAYIFYKQKIRIRKANIWGKLKMNFEVLAILFLFINLIWQIGWMVEAAVVLMALAVIFAVLSFIDIVTSNYGHNI